MFLSSNPDERCQVALRFQIGQYCQYSTVLTYKTPDSGVGGALNGLFEALARTEGGRVEGGPRWLGHPGPMRSWHRQVKGSLLACLGKAQLFCLREA